MTKPSVDRDLAAHLDTLRERLGDSVRIDRVAEVVTELLESMSGELSGADLRLYQELESLAEYIHQAKADIARLRPQDIGSEFIVKATDELDAIVGATENATNQILDAAEIIETALGDAPPELAEKLQDATTRIYEACNFQDITGQRITKVVRTLKHIEAKVEDLVRAFHPDGAPGHAAPQGGSTDGATDSRPDAHLLNGPQLPDDAHKQADIDALLASFDK